MKQLRWGVGEQSVSIRKKRREASGRKIRLYSTPVWTDVSTSGTCLHVIFKETWDLTTHSLGENMITDAWSICFPPPKEITWPLISCCWRTQHICRICYQKRLRSGIYMGVPPQQIKGVLRRLRLRIDLLWQKIPKGRVLTFQILSIYLLSSNWLQLSPEIKTKQTK